MSRKQKLYDQVRLNPKNVSYAQLKTLLEAFGYELRQHGGGSHRWFIRSGCPPIHFPEKNPVGEVYVKQVIRILEELSDFNDE